MAGMVPLEGLEPPTLSLGRNCSSIELQRLTARVYRLAIACSAASRGARRARPGRGRRGASMARCGAPRGSGSGHRRSVRSDRRHAASDRSTSRPTARATIGDAVDVGPNPMYLAVSRRDGRARHRARTHRRAWSRPGRSRATTSGRSAAPARTGAADPCHLAFDESGDLAVRGELLGRPPHGAPGRLRMSRPTPRTPSTFTGTGPNRDGRRRRTPHQAVVDSARGRLLVRRPRRRPCARDRARRAARRRSPTTSRATS